MKRFLIGGLAAAFLVSGGYAHDAAGAAEKLGLRIAPAVCSAPGAVVVYVSIETDSRNRELEVVADSPEFYRRTVIELDGGHAPRVHQIALVGLPGGEYDVTATLSGAQGVLASVHRTLMVSR